MVLPTHAHIGDNQTDKEGAFNARLADLEGVLSNVVTIDVTSSNVYTVSKKEYYNNCVFKIDDAAGANGNITITVPAVVRPTFAVVNDTAQSVYVIVSGQTASRSIASGDVGYYFYDGTEMQSSHGTVTFQPFTHGNIDITTTSYDSQSHDISAQIGGNGQSVRFNSDGTKMYVARYDSRIIYEYDLNTAWDLSDTVTYNSVNLDCTSEFATGLTGFVFADSGSKLYACGLTSITSEVNRYDLSTPYDLSTASFATGQTKNISEASSNIQDIAVNSTGDTMLILETGASGTLMEFDMSSAWDVTTLTVTTTLLIDDEFTEDARDMHVSSNGDQVFIAADTDHVIFQFDLQTGYDLDTIGLASVYDVSGTSTSPRGIFIGNSDSKLYMCDNTADLVYQFSVSPPTAVPGWELDITGTSYDTKSLDFSTEDTLGTGVFFKSDGTKVYVTSYNKTVYQYSLSTAWDISTASYDSVSFSVATQVTTGAVGLAFSEDGTKMYVGDYGDDDIHQYSLTAWDLSTAAYASKVCTAHTGTQLRGFFFSKNGHVMYTIDSNNQDVQLYWLKTAWDISTAKKAPDWFFDVNTEGTDSRGGVWNPKGSQCFVTNQGSDVIAEYTTGALGRPDKLGSAQTFSISAQSADSAHMFFKPDDGSKLYIIDDVDNKVYQYSTSYL